MTVYVDDALIPARVGRWDSRWSHLIADTREELHAFAAKLGLNRRWFQDPCRPGKALVAEPGSRAAENWHYDLTESKRRQAIALGAQPLTSRQMCELLNRRYGNADRQAGQSACGGCGVPSCAGGCGLW